MYKSPLEVKLIYKQVKKQETPCRDYFYNPNKYLRLYNIVDFVDFSIAERVFLGLYVTLLYVEHKTNHKTTNMYLLYRSYIKNFNFPVHTSKAFKAHIPKALLWLDITNQPCYSFKKKGNNYVKSRST